ncbi:hypothetical protein BJX68DRAFT_3257 [Aspergillus pseudodeflectus]|uniref:Uncharacterized protein n=1 Tax=Aspergillus pseudodeflectus TaxID=176178 RepID=A0ABR4LAK5_9EURO
MFFCSYCSIAIYSCPPIHGPHLIYLSSIDLANMILIAYLFFFFPLVSRVYRVCYCLPRVVSFKSLVDSRLFA